MGSVLFFESPLHCDVFHPNQLTHLFRKFFGMMFLKKVLAKNWLAFGKLLMPRIETETYHKPLQMQKWCTAAEMILARNTVMVIHHNTSWGHCKGKNGAASVTILARNPVVVQKL